MMTAQVMAGATEGGAELFFERLCSALHGAGDTVLPVIRGDDARAERLRGQGLEPACLPFGGVFDLATKWRLRRCLEAARPAVVVGWMGRAASVLPNGAWTLVGRLGGYYDLKRFARCRHLVANTADIAAWIADQGWPRTRVHHLPNFVPDLRGVAPTDRIGLGVPQDAPLIVALGRLHPAKGFDTLLHAVAALPEAHVVIGGEGSAREALMRLAHSLGIAARVHLPGWQRAVGPLLAAADVFVSSARHEPLGNAVIEAWSAGRPVVATAASGPSELINDGEDGMLCPTEDSAALASAIGAVLKAPAQAAAMGRAGRARYEAGFAQAGVVAQWQAFLASVAP